MCTLRRNVIRLSTLALALGGCSDDSGGNSTITFTAGPTPLTFAAAQVAEGPWQVITPSTDGKYRIAADGPTYGIVAVCGESSTVTVLHATTSETTTPNVDCSSWNVETPATLMGTISGSETASLVIASVQASAQGSYSRMAPVGTWDVFALDRPSTPTKIIRKNDVTLVESAPTVLDFDFATEGFAPERHTVTFQGLETGETTTVWGDLRTTHGGTWVPVSMSNDGSYQGLPASELRADDILRVSAMALTPDGSNRQVRRWVAATDDFSAALSPMPTAWPVGADTPDPYLRMRAAIPSELDADRVDLVYSQQQGSGSMMWNATLSSGYIAAASLDAYTLPDLSALEGFMSNWMLDPGSSVDWQIVQTSSTASANDVLGTDQNASADVGRTDTITQFNGDFRM